MKKITSENDSKYQLFASYKTMTMKFMGDRDFTEFIPLEYSSQTVNGTNYEIKYSIGDNQTIIVKVYEPLPNTNAVPQIKSVLDEFGTLRTGAMAIRSGLFATTLAAAYLLA